MCLDSVVQGGDAVWEGLRITDGHAIQLEPHLDRLVDSAHALAFSDIPTRDALRDAIFQTLEANGMRDGVHCRITLTPGEKVHRAAWIRGSMCTAPPSSSCPNTKAWSTATKASVW